MPDMWERARVRHESTPVPEELEFAVASALRAGQRRLQGRRALRRSVSGVLAGCACFCAAGQRQSGLRPGGVRRAGAGRSGPGGHRHGVPTSTRQGALSTCACPPWSCPGTAPTWSSVLTWPFRPASTRCFGRPRTGRGPSAAPMWPPAVRREDFIPS